MVKRLLFFTLALIFFQISEVFSQISAVTVDPGPYTPGSSIAATFSLGTDCINKNNTFEVYLSDAVGNFVSTTPIGSYTGFYAAFVNGTIPAGTPDGTGYKLRIRSTAPVYTSESAPFTIKTGTAVTAKLTSPSTISSAPVTFGSCDTDPGQPNTTFFFTNASSSPNATVTIINQLDPGPSSIINFASVTEAKQFVAGHAHYTMLVKATLPDGTIGTTAYFLVNNLAVTAFTTTSGNTVCFPVGAFEYLVNTERNGGIKDNFPGNTYSITWGDGTSDVYTYCEILKQNSKVSHTFTRSSCGLTYTSGTETTYNAFGINVGVISPFCNKVGSPLSTAARVVSRPQNIISAPTVACIGNVTLINNSTAGQKPNSNAADCVPNTVLYTWNIDGTDVAINVPFSNYTHNFTTKGIHTIRLTSISNGTCQADPTEITICIQDPPKPSFTLPAQTICLTPGTITPTNTSVIDNTCPTAIPVYTWTVSPAAGVTYVGGTNSHSPIPQFHFSQIGIYNITLTIQSATCQATTLAQQIVVDGEPQASLSIDAKLCQLGQFSFGPGGTTTNTIITGNAVDLPDTYTWEVTGGAYSFVDLSNPNSKYPTIDFTEYKAYTVKLTYKNECNTITRTQKITFSESPVPGITAIPDPICYNDIINLKGTILKRTPQTTFQWIGAPGAVFSSPDDLNTTYTPTVAERNAGTAHIRLVVTTGLSGLCATVEAAIDVTITPNNISTNPIPSRSQDICTGNRATFTPTSVVSGSTFTWTATNADGNATGFSATGSGNINEVITNTSLTENTKVVYTITPATLACTGIPFTFTVTITPRPVITATAARATICSNDATAITLTTSNMLNTKYTWTGAVTGNITGNIDVTTQTAATTINDILVNSGTTRGTVVYTITPYSATGCAGTPKTVTINVDPAVTEANAGIDESICATNSYTLQGTAAIVGTGRWTIEPENLAVTIVNPTSPTTLVTGLSPGQTYTFRWTISASGACNESFDDVTIIVNEPTIPGTTSTSEPTVCQDINTGTITLTGNLGNVLRWESSLDGTTWITAENTNTTTTYTFNNLTVPTHFRAVIQNGGCTIENSTPTKVNISPATTIAIAGDDQELCDEASVSLKADPVATGETGLWTLISGNTNAQITTPVNEETTVTNLIAGQTYVFRWTITGNSPCGSTFDEVSVINNSPIAQNTINTVSVVCNGQQVIINGSVPSGGNGTYTYTWERKLDAGAWSVISNETGEDLTIILTTTGTVSFRRNIASGSCTSTSNEFPITVQPPITNNTIAADQIICSGKMPAILTGSVPLGGNGSYLYQWQSSTDGTTWTDIPGALIQNYQPPILTQSIFYRRTVGTLACSGTFQNASTSVKITVNQNAESEFTWATDTGCAPYNLPITTVPYLDRNATYTWYANNVLLPSTGSSFPGYIITNSNQFVTIKLVVTSSLGCSEDKFEHTFGTNQAVPASFTPVATSDCGPLTVNFVNTSLQTASATFRWNFGNGKTSNDANPEPVVFQVDPSGKDTTYTVTLYSETTCGIDSAKGTVLVKSGPRPVFSPSTTNGCSPLPVIFSNNSPLQVGTTYVFDFGDGSPTVPMTDRSDVPHTYRTTTNTQSFIATMTATNECGTVTSVPYTIVVKPNTVRANLIVNGDQLSGCAPFTATFDNNSTGATSFSVDFKDGSQPRPSFSAPERFQHIFTVPGSYDVTLTATNGCSTDTKTVIITVLPQPSPSFTADNILGCPGMVVQFRNTTPDAQSNSFIWDFGDGSTSTDLEPPSHTYNGNQEYYTVTLTASNAQGCPNTVVMNQYIHIVQPPVAAFNVNPSTEISIPDYTFNFQDESANNPTLWEWDFGDETGSALKNPSHTYLDTGTYKVTLKTTNQQGCFTTTFKNVTIKGVPGYLFVPNSFIPGDTRPELREFRAKGSGIQSWRLSIFNKWGQQIWETTKLDEGRPADGWDGTFKGQALPQGVYYWKIDVQMVNGAEWKGMTYDKSAPKRTGAIHLIR